MTREEAIKILSKETSMEKVNELNYYAGFSRDKVVGLIQEAMEMGAKALEKQEDSKWIPCSERLPNSNGCYLVWRPRFFGGEIGMPAICYFDGQNTWHDAYGVNFERVLNESDVVAWQPLPEPYKGE